MTNLILAYKDQMVVIPFGDTTMYVLGREIIGPLLKNEEADLDGISRRHFRLFRKGNQVAILDGASEEEPSTNGIWVNGREVKKAQLHSRDKISFWEGGPEVVVVGLCDNFREF